MMKDYGEPYTRRISCMQLARLSQHSFGIRMASPVTLHGSVPSNSLGAGMRHLRGLTLRDLVEIKAAHVRQGGGDVQHKPIRNDHPNYSHSQFTTLLQGDQLETIRRMSQFRVRPRRAEL